MLIVSVVVIFVLGYHGPRKFLYDSKTPTADTVIANSKKLKGTPYDPFMGGHDNIGEKLGFIVCSDVVDISYGLSGYSWRQILQNDFIRHRSAYDVRDGNNPKNPYFHRRARNMYDFFKANHRLESSAYIPSPGDLVFYRKANYGAVTHVALVTSVNNRHFMVMESAPRTLLAQEVDQTSPPSRGWVFAGFGRMDLIE